MQDEDSNEEISEWPRVIHHLSPEAFKHFIETCENPPVSTEKLIALMREYKLKQNK